MLHFQTVTHKKLRDSHPAKAFKPPLLFRHGAGSLIHAAGLTVIIKCFQWCNAGLDQAIVPQSTNKIHWTLPPQKKIKIKNLDYSWQNKRTQFEMKHKKAWQTCHGWLAESQPVRGFTMSEESFEESQKGTQTREKVQSLTSSPSFFKNTLISES